MPYFRKGGKAVSPIPDPEYVRNGLVLHLDGISNSGSGHSNTATLWTDLIGSNDAIVMTANWGSNSYILSKTLLNYIQLPINNSLSFPQGYTLQITLKINEYSLQAASGLFSKRSGAYFNVFPFTAQSHALRVDRASGSLMYTGQRIPLEQGMQLTYSENADGFGVLHFNNSEVWRNLIPADIGKFALDSVSYIGRDYNANQYHYNGEIYSVRLYDRQLSTAEIDNNFKVDQGRFGLPSALKSTMIKIGDRSQNSYEFSDWENV